MSDRSIAEQVVNRIHRACVRDKSWQGWCRAHMSNWPAAEVSGHCDAMLDYVIVVEQALGLYLQAMGDEYAIVYDGDPFMDGTHERLQIGHFTTLDAALAAFESVLARSTHAPKPGLRIEHRYVTPWTLIEGGEDE